MGTFGDSVNGATEAPLYPDQKEIETAVLQILASVINSDVSEVKYELLELYSEDFHFSDHRDIFAAMKKLYNGGDPVNVITVRGIIGENWVETLKTIFEGDVPDVKLAHTYVKKIGRWALLHRLRVKNRQFSDRLDELAGSEDISLDQLVSELQSLVFNLSSEGRLTAETPSEADLIDNFVLDLRNPQKGHSTGFKLLDEAIGGLRPSLITLAGPPSAGKTTFVKQLTDNVAKTNGVPVLFFSFEQSAPELRVKSLARITEELGDPQENELIKRGEASKEVVEKAAQEYKKFGKWIKITEGDHRHTVEHIRLAAQIERKRTGKSPVVVLDYLQVVPAGSSFSGDKRGSVDYIVSELRRTARDLEAPIIALSSMSRKSYSKGEKVTMDAFKESGGIEYGADLAIVLVPEKDSASDGLDPIERDSEEIRPVALRILKNRWGLRKKISFKYKVKQDFFEEQTAEDIGYVNALGGEEK